MYLYKLTALGNIFKCSYAINCFEKIKNNIVSNKGYFFLKLLSCKYSLEYNAFNVYRRELAPGTVSLTGDRAQGDDSKHWAYSSMYILLFFCCFFVLLFHYSNLTSVKKAS